MSKGTVVYLRWAPIKRPDGSHFTALQSGRMNDTTRRVDWETVPIGEAARNVPSGVQS